MKTPRFDIECSAGFCFACSQENPIGLKLKPIHDGEKVIADFTPGKFHQGWGNAIHGGILYTLLDEVAAYAMLCQGIELGLTAKSQIRFRQVLPINEPVRATAWVTKLTSRLVESKGVVTLKDNTVAADGDFLFYVVRRSNKTILWDMDGVISDSYRYHFASWQDIFSRRGVTFGEEDFRRLFGARNDSIIRTVMGEDLSEADARALVREKEETFRHKATGQLRPFIGALELLASLKKGNFRLGLVSSAPEENINLVLAELKLAGVFDCVVCGTDVPESKPSPQIYLAAARKLGVAPKDCIVIEDSPLGVKAAKAAGMKCLGITNTHPQQYLSEADRVIDSLQNIDLVSLLTRI